MQQFYKEILVFEVSELKDSEVKNQWYDVCKFVCLISC